MPEKESPEYEPMLRPANGLWNEPSLLINWRSDDEQSYREGFYHAAYTMAIGMVNGTGPRAEVLAYPMLWCFRQFVELSLKRVLEIGVQLAVLDEKAIAAIRYKHDIHALWQHAERVLHASSLGQIEDKFFHDLADVIAELHQLDPSSTALRYSKTRGGDASLGGDPLILDVTRFVEHMDVSMNWLTENLKMLERRLQS